MAKKEARITWNRPRNMWVIRYWSETDHEWNDDSYYPVKDVNEETELGWVSESLITRVYELQDLGYKVVFA